MTNRGLKKLGHLLSTEIVYTFPVVFLDMRENERNAAPSTGI